MKKALALILSVMMIMSLCTISVSATLTANWGAYDGTLFYTDFENVDNNALKVANGGFFAYGAPMETIGGDQAVTYPAPGQTATWIKNSGTGAKTITTGKVTWTMDVKVDGTAYTGSTAAADTYPGVYFSIESPSAIKYLQISNVWTNREEEQGVIIARESWGTMSQSDLDNTDLKKVYFSANVDHELKIVLDLDANTLTSYLDDQQIKSQTFNYDYIVDSWWGIVPNSSYIQEKFPATPEGVVPHIIFDDMKVELSDVEVPEVLPEGYLMNLTFDNPKHLNDYFDEYATGSLDYASIEAEAGNNYLSLSERNGETSFKFAQNVFSQIQKGKVYEFSYDIKSNATSSGIGSPRVLLYGASGANIGFGAYFPGHGFVLPGDQNISNIDATGKDVWYTVKVEFCYSDDGDTYVVWQLRNPYQLIATRSQYGIENVKGNTNNILPEPSAWNSWGGMFDGTYYITFWNDKLTDVQFDNFVLREKAANEDYTISSPVITINDAEIVAGVTKIAADDTVNVTAYGAKSGTLIVAAYNQDGSLKAIKTGTTSIRDRYQMSFKAGADFENATKIKAFLFTGIGGAFQPLTNSKTYNLK